jgi:hypothetical protein
MEEFEKSEEELTIAEHAARENVPPSILSAVMQFENWAEGKQVSKSAFKGAVESFLNAPAWGRGK